MIQYKTFKVADLFNRAQLGDTNLKKGDLTKTGELVITSGKTNYGILGRTTRAAKVLPSNTITVDMFGYVYYRDFPYKMVTHGRVMSLSSDIIKNREVGLYLASSLSYLSKVFGYNNMATWKKLKDKQLELPVNAYGVLNYDYMTQYIRQLQGKYFRHLGTFLKNCDLENTVLTDTEMAALKSVKHDFARFKIKTLFNIQKGKRLTKAKQSLGNTPFIGSSSTNHGVTAHIGQAPIFEGNTLTVSYNGSVGQAFYQDDPYWASDDINVLTLKKEYGQLNRQRGNYLAACLSVAGKAFGYSRKWNVERMKDTNIELPVTSAGDIDFAYMENYISAIEKLQIKKVIKYKDKMIQETKA